MSCIRLNTKSKLKSLRERDCHAHSSAVGHTAQQGKKGPKGHVLPWEGGGAGAESLGFMHCIHLKLNTYAHDQREACSSTFRLLTVRIAHIIDLLRLVWCVVVQTSDSAGT
jgi:hypothetical protein